MRRWLSRLILDFALWFTREPLFVMRVDAGGQQMLQDLYDRAECTDLHDLICTALDVYDSLLQFDELGYTLYVESAMGDHIVQLRGLRPDEDRTTEICTEPDDSDWN